jgi:potassium/hydrogen antiporter
MSQVIFALGSILFLAYVFLVVFERTRIPDVLLLILVGVVLGPYVLGMTSPADYGKVGAVMSTVALVVVLLLGGIELDLQTLGTALRPTLLLTLVSFSATVALVAAFGAFVLGLSPLVRALYGKLAGTTVGEEEAGVQG